MHYSEIDNPDNSDFLRIESGMAIESISMRSGEKDFIEINNLIDKYNLFDHHDLCAEKLSYFVDYDELEIIKKYSDRELNSLIDEVMHFHHCF